MRATWKECEACDMHVPLLSVHCSHCRKCIYALDHHCYFLGHCIGRSNQKYFIVFCLYAAMGSAIGKLFKCWMVYILKYLERLLDTGKMLFQGNNI